MSGVADLGHRDVLTLDCLALAEHVGGIRRAVVAFAADAGVTEDNQMAIALAVSEAASNVVLHAYREQPAPGRLIVQAWAQDSTLHVHVIDEGMGIKPRIDSPGAGLGLGVIAAVTKHCTVERRSDRSGARLRLIFALS